MGRLKGWTKSERISDYDGHKEVTYTAHGVECEARVTHNGETWRYLLINMRHAVYGDITEEITEAHARAILKSDGRAIHANDYGRIQHAIQRGDVPSCTN